MNNTKTIVAKDLAHLKKLVEKEIKVKGNQCDLNHIDVSNVTDLSYLFYNTAFNGNISKWNVSKVKEMEGTFKMSEFNGDISNWDTSSLEDISEIFSYSKFNQDISKWNTKNLQIASMAFYSSHFNQDISAWDVSNLTSIHQMFNSSEFSHDLSAWKPIKLDTKIGAFDDCKAPVPYWFEAEDIEKTVKAHTLNQELDAKLVDKSKNTKNKIKI